ncbi:MAG: hypothetical protein A2428_00105 [Bdellovibrionales bacterium RIFOXYC1_FULL_54_43]|nr:MAG: hypothetical protein A2428_00105 [Bdellovibrionales bacterium RIFOXYC1_FULL_54_43]OFZ81836.1 MAG: hypothetical protein A2603_06515 [Bdellovibrionales bacterium RIFOXYD1_FULL_55_31]
MPKYVREALQRLNEAGHVAYVVGGSVRDFFLKRESKDHDIATSADPDELCRIFPDAITVGKAFGVLKIPIQTTADSPPELLEVATFRQDLEYEDHRHPKAVRFSGAVEDASRRDFTVNALYYDPKTSRVLDPVNGLDDLSDRILRAIGNPRARFKEDALRLLRAVRFASTLEFTIEPKTAEAIKTKAHLINHVSSERIREELTSMWCGPHPALALELLSKFGLLRLVLPEVEALHGVSQSPLHHPEGDVWNHTVKVMKCLSLQNPRRPSPLAWAALLHDIGKPAAASRSGGKNFTAHEVDGVKMAIAIGDRLKMSAHEIAAVSAIISDHVKFREVFQMREATLQRFIHQPHFEEMLALHKADATASDGNLAFFEFCSSRLAEKKTVFSGAKLIDGNDLIQLGLKPGKEFAEILRAVEDLALEKKLHTKDEALEYVVKHFVK